MIGTLIGMVQMFANMTDPSKLGPFMATALLATLMARWSRTCFCLPIADKLHGKLLDEETNRTLIIDGILMIRDSKSPTLVRENVAGLSAGKTSARGRRTGPGVTADLGFGKSTMAKKKRGDSHGGGHGWS